MKGKCIKYGLNMDYLYYITKGKKIEEEKSEKNWGIFILVR